MLKSDFFCKKIMLFAFFSQNFQKYCQIENLKKKKKKKKKPAPRVVS